MKLGSKIGLGFGALIVVAMILGGVGYYSSLKNTESVHEIGVVRLPSVQSLAAIKDGGMQIKSAQRTLLNLDLDPASRNRQYEIVAKAREAYEAAWKVYEPLPQTQEEAALWKEFVPAWEAWRKDNNEFFSLSKRLEELKIGNPLKLEREVARFRGDHHRLETQVLTMLEDKKVFEGGDDHTACAFGKWKAAQKIENSDIAGAIAAADDPHRRFHESVKKIKELVKAGNVEAARKTYAQEMTPAAETVFGQFDRILQVSRTASDLADKLDHQAMEVCRATQTKADDLLNKIIKINVDVADEAVKDATTKAAFFKLLSLVAAGIALVVGVLLAYFITRGITKPINRIIQGLDDGAEQVNEAAAQVSTASQQLAEGASEQASSLEETSSALEEMASMARQNAENSKQANEFMVQAQGIIAEADTAMKEASNAMNQISEASDKISKIIKVIEEIAFQTNLLALNAAVEAARAGEHGKGFAVVADEVRNLAQRAAQAARETGDLIEQTVARVQRGVELNQTTSASFTKIGESAAKVGQLVAQISQASAEQAQGVDQVNTAVAQMDKVTQQNAANAEESSSAAQELSAQAQTVKGMVEELIALVGGSNAAGRSTHGPSRRSGVRTVYAEQSVAAHIHPTPGKHAADHTAKRSQGAPGTAPKAGSGGPVAVSAEETIPLEGDLKGF